MNREKLKKILVPLVILVVIGGIWGYKNHQETLQLEAELAAAEALQQQLQEQIQEQLEAQEAAAAEAAEAAQAESPEVISAEMPADYPVVEEAEAVEETTDVAQMAKDFMLTSTTPYDIEALSQYGLPMILDFGSDSCGPCLLMAPALEAVNAEMQGRALVKFVDVWAYPEAASDFPIQVIPTQIFVNRDGTPYVPSEDIPVEFIMYSTRDTNEHVFTVHQGGLSEEEMYLILADMGVE